ncbi:hypothetical protein JNW90_07450 [Micromonospora sp. STR1s_5]|nr:hypothetical protein [Micromonospora sp. STR1s_5]
MADEERVCTSPNLIAVQFAITWSSVRWARFKGLIKAEPTLLLHAGEFLDGAMRRERVTRDDLLSAVRSELRQSPFSGDPEEDDESDVGEHADNENSKEPGPAIEEHRGS